MANEDNANDHRRTRIRQWTVMTNVVALGSAVAGGAALFVAVPSQMVNVISGGEKLQSNEIAVTGKIVDAIGDMRHDIANIQQEQRALQQPSKDSIEAAQFRNLDNRLKILEQREAKIEQVIMDNPMKALQIPLMQRDIENTRKTVDQRFESAKIDNDRLYDQTKWVFGFFFTGIVALIVSNLGNFLTKKKD